MPTAFLTVHNAQKKPTVAEFAQRLVELGFSIWGSRGTATHLRKSGFDVTDIASIVGEPILEHQVVTLSRELHAALLAEWLPQDLAELERLGVPRVDLVYVEPYPIHEAIADPAATVESVRILTDVGGRALLLSAAKGRRVVLCKENQLQHALSRLRLKLSGDISKADWDNYLLGCASAAELYVSEYSAASGQFLKEQWLGANLETAA